MLPPLGGEIASGRLLWRGNDAPETFAQLSGEWSWPRSIISIELACPECGGACINLQNGSYMIDEDHKTVECESSGKELKTPLAQFKRRQVGIDRQNEE